MPLYLAATPDHLTRARAVTPRLAHVAYRLGPGSELLAAPLPPALRGGLMVLSDWDCPPVEEPDRLARQIARTCLRRGYAGVAADFDPPARPDRLALLEALSPLLASCGRALYVPEHYAACHGASVLLCTALSGGTLEGRLNQAAARYGAEHLALDLQRLAMDFPVPCPSGQGHMGQARRHGPDPVPAGRPGGRPLHLLFRRPVRPLLHPDPGGPDPLYPV